MGYSRLAALPRYYSLALIELLCLGSAAFLLTLWIISGSRRAPRGSSRPTGGLNFNILEQTFWNRTKYTLLMLVEHLLLCGQSVAACQTSVFQSISYALGFLSLRLKMPRSW
jgi:hypothetical protein